MRAHLSVLDNTCEGLLIQAQCPLCNEFKTVLVPESGYYAWMNGGVLIQKALPSLSNSERELLLTGYDDACWKKLFLPEEDEDEGGCGCPIHKNHDDCEKFCGCDSSHSGHFVAGPIVGGRGTTRS